MSKSVLVIGGSGFFGSELVKTLQQDQNIRVSFTDSKSLNLIEDNLIKKTKGYDTLINLTGQVSKPFSTCLALNSVGIQKLIDACNANHQKLIQASTTLVYGTASEVDEQSPLNPESPYATAKAMAEFMIQRQLPKKQHLIVRLSNLYGPGQNKGLFWYIADCIAHNRKIVIPDNDGSLRRHYLHITDAANIVHQLLIKDAQGVVVVAGPDNYTIKELIAMYEKRVGRKLATQYAAPAISSNISHIKTDTLKTLINPNFNYSVAEYIQTAV